MAEINSPDPFRFEREIAISVLEKQDALALKALKRFLLNLSGGPKAIETVLAQAVCHCAEERPETLDWILAQANQLEPELSLAQWAQQVVVNRLSREGCALELDFDLGRQTGDKQLQLHLEERAVQLLQETSSRGEWLVLNRLFEMEPKN